MTMPDFRPHISRIYPELWKTNSGQNVNGIVLFGYSGIAAHLTQAEAYKLADQIVDAAERMPTPDEVRKINTQRRLTQTEATTAPPKPKRQRKRRRTIHTTTTLTDASGAPEEPLETTPAESE